MSEPTTPGLISSEKLCSFTGLTDRRHRQIAKEGYFPPPEKGQYVLAATITGMFKYYRELSERKFGVMAQEEEKKLRAERKIKETDLEMRGIELGAKKEEFVSVEAMRLELVRCFEAIKMDIESLELLAPQLAGLSIPELSKRLREGLREALTHLSQLKWVRHFKSSKTQPQARSSPAR